MQVINMKNMKLIITASILFLMVLPSLFAAKDERTDISIEKYCYFEMTDAGGNPGIGVNATFKNRGNTPIFRPRWDSFQNDKAFPIEQYEFLIHSSAWYDMTLEPGQKITDFVAFFPFYAYYPGSDRGQLVDVRVYADFPNELNESNEHNNFVHLNIFVEPGLRQKCSHGVRNNLRHIRNISQNKTIEPATVNVTGQSSPIKLSSNNTTKKISPRLAREKSVSKKG